MRGRTSEYNCKCCGSKFTARIADRNRGWARYCSKSCKAKKQEARTGQYKKFLNETSVGKRGYSPEEYHNDIHPFSEEAFE